MRRHILGVISVLFLCGAAGLYFSGEKGSDQFLLSVCLRVGFVLGAWWLAYHQAERLFSRFPPWLLGCLGCGLLIIVVRPKAILYVAPGLAAIALLQFVGWLFKPLPNPKKRSSSSNGTKTNTDTT